MTVHSRVHGSFGATFAPPLRLAAVSYLNTLPLIEGLEKLRGVKLTVAPPSRLIELLLTGEADAALAPVIDFQRAARPMTLIPAGMIGCDGPTMTVRLYSSTPFERLRRVHADTESHTSVALMWILLRRMFNISPEVVEFDARAARAPAPGDAEMPIAMLIIGDKVVTDPPSVARYPHQLDLGEAWKGVTGLPFVYAVWMCDASRADSPEVRSAAAALDRQRRHNEMRLDWIASRRAPEHRWPIDLAQEYLGRMLRYDVGAREREAIDAFFDEAAALGVIPDRRPTTWTDAPCPA